MLYSNQEFWQIRSILPIKNATFWAATLSGLAVGGFAATLLSVGDLPFSPAIGAFVGGVIAAYVLYGKVGQATAAGAAASIFGTPFFLGVSQIFLIFEIIPIPSTPTPPLDQLQAAVVFIFMTNLLAGAVGGALMGAIRHPKAAAPATQSSATVVGAQQAKYCVQCGAQVPAGTSICPHCNAQQPQ